MIKAAGQRPSRSCIKEKTGWSMQNEQATYLSLLEK
jgi:hypothetical protein